MNFTLPICIIMALLSFGLTRYYSIQYDKNIESHSEIDDGISTSLEDERNIQNQISKITFVLVYLISLIICAFFSIPRLEVVYTNWNLLDITNIIELVAGIMLCFFMPGYAVVVLVIKKYKMSQLLKIISGYLCSMLITALTIYISAIFFDTNIFENKFLLIAVYLSILIIFVIRYSIYRIILNTDINIYRIIYHNISNVGNKFQTILKVNLSELIIFGSLFGLVILSTYYLYGGITIGDQWYHQNRAIHFMYGNFKEFLMTNGQDTDTYPPLLSSLLAGLTSLSGVPLVNTYASLAFLNIMAVFAFYNFCFTWFPSDKKRAALFASSLFVIASGFGWVYMLYLTDTSPIGSQISSISNFVEDKIRVTDIRLSANFMIAAFPDFSTGLILVSLPAGFVLLSLVYVEFGNKISYITILSLISTLGILFHDEFYIFIIVSSLLPLTYNLKNKSYVYFAFLISFSFAYLIDGLLPVKYFTSNTISGIPLIELNFIFTLVTFSLYLLRQKLNRHLHAISIPSFQFRKKFHSYAIKISFIPKVLLVSIVVYVCALCLLVWTQLPANYVDIHTQKYGTPWYLYSMRLGVVGLLGVASILSYLFKRFEKEVFVFGIIFIVALLAGPYYNEHRFNKYLMVGMIGFASLIIFKLLIFMNNKKPILSGMIVGSIVIVASLSTVMYIGYNALVIQTQDYTHALGRRNFPSTEEMNLLDTMRSKIQGSNPYNIASFPNEYNLREGGIISKLHAFSGLPNMKIAQTHYILNTSTLDSFYHLLESSNTRYIVMPTDGINPVTLTDPTRFALDNFQQIRNDNNYLVLNVPSLHGPSPFSENDIGIIYKKDESFEPTISDTKRLQINNYTFNFQKDTMKFLDIQKENQSEKAILYGYKKNAGLTIWSKNLNGDDGVNYIELKFRILGGNKTGIDTAGLKWSDGEKVYFVSLSNKGLELREQSTNGGNTILLSQNSEIKKNDLMWYLIKIENLENSINVYVDNLLKIKVPKNLSDKNTSGILKVGINSKNNAVEFEPLQIGKIPWSDKFYDAKNRYNYYYALNSLALSGTRYSTFADDDYSLLSKKSIIIPFDPHDWNDTLFNYYLNYARSGGTLVVINSDDNFNGRFGKLFSIESKSNQTEEFTRVIRHDNQQVLLNASGTGKDIEIKPSADVNVMASYRNEDYEGIAPFAIEKHFPNSGRIIYINGKDYFDAIYNNPKKYFLSLANFSDLLVLNHKKSIIPQSVTEPIKRYIGDAKMSGKASINSSSISIINASTNSHNFEVKTTSVLNKYGKLMRHFENASVMNMKLFGQYEVFLNSMGTLTLPSTNSHKDYVGMLIPNESNMTVKLLGNNNSYAEIVTKNNSSLNIIKVNNESKIDFYNMRFRTPLNSIPLLLKNPEITINGNITFEKNNFYGQPITNYVPLNLSGQVKAKFDFIDDYKAPYRNGTKIQYLTSLQSITIDGKRNQDEGELKLPGDISPDIKKRGLDVPLRNILSSSSNIVLVTALTAITLAGIWLLRERHVY